MDSVKLVLLTLIASGLLLPLNSLGKEDINTVALNAELPLANMHMDSNTPRANSLPLQASPTETIVIYNNSDFARVAAQNLWPGDGTLTNPYRIARLTIILEVQFMAIYSSTVHFVIQKCKFTATESIKIITLHKTQNARIDDCTFQASTGIMITSSANNSIVNNKMVGSRIRILNSESITISNNTFELFGVPTQEYAAAHPALDIRESQRLMVSGNDFSRNGIGIQMQNGTASNFTQNFLFNNTGGGMVFKDCGTNVLKDNSFYYGGLRFEGAALENYLQRCENNSHNGRPLVYLRDTSNLTLLSPGQVVVVNCTDIAVENGEFDGAPIYIVSSQRIIIANSSSIRGPYGMLISNSGEISLLSSDMANSTDYGAVISGSVSVTLSECKITNHFAGIVLVNDLDVTVKNSIVSENKGTGISVAYSDNVTIKNSSISKSETGISIRGDSTNNTILNCSLFSNFLGIKLGSNSSDNEVVWNNFAGKPEEESESW
ncbi:MAG: right-handed parallel beta-helix repeat-containing protein, partial [Candidatus Hodarchaeales archaeon]